MVALDQKRFDPGFMNCATHALTGVQILYYLSHTWAQGTDKSVILWCKPGDGASKANAVRVALSRERKARKVKAAFELRFSEVWAYTHMGIRGEAIKVTQVSGGGLIQMRAAFAALQGRQP